MVKLTGTNGQAMLYETVILLLHLFIHIVNTVKLALKGTSI
jgi:hypothetical protein